MPMLAPGAVAGAISACRVRYPVGQFADIGQGYRPVVVPATGITWRYHMGIGAGIFLLAIGAVLAFAISDRIGGVDLTTVGYILMAAGALGLVMAMVITRQRAHTSHTVEQRRDIID
jgi:hypothetical protein